MNFDGMSAVAISDWFLERTGKAMRDGDFDSFMSCFALPYCISTFQKHRVYETRDAFQDLFEMVRDDRKVRGITDVVRKTVNAGYVGQDLIKTTHETRMLGNDQLIEGPYPVYSEIRRLDGQWRITRGDFAVRLDLGQDWAPKVVAGREGL